MSTKKLRPVTGPDPTADTSPAAQADVPAIKAGSPYRPAFPVVGIGASAGGLEAFTQLLEALPVDTGMGFVFVLHLSPERVSMLPEILGRATRMAVCQARAEQQVQPNCVYVIPPGLDMRISRGVLKLAPRRTTRGQHRPIDEFLRSLAEDRGHLSIGVILSGTADDGTLGLEDVKAQGGLTFAQDATAQEDSMPRSAIATGCVDFVLAPREISKELARIARHPHTAPDRAGADGKTEGRRLGRILQRLSSATGVDFARYKSSTLGRRVSRRMAVHKLQSLEDYEELLGSHPEEVDALYQDVLIHVTRFFRDPEVFEALRDRVLPQLFRDRAADEPLRIWVLGCSSGEEAYSLAITCSEFVEEQGLRTPVQVFASDLSVKMIDRARAGIYPPSIAQDVSPERLHRCFRMENGSYHVNRSIRDSCVFAPHNVLADPPFSRMDLVSCRNLLIYMGPDLQQQVLPVLHFALKPGGFLLLGRSETPGAARDLFAVEDARHRIYTRRAGSTARLTLGLFPPIVRPAPSEARTRSFDGHGPDDSGEVQRQADRVLAARYTPPGVLINVDLEILKFWGDTSPYLAPPPGRASLNVLQLARPGLLVALRTAIRNARSHDTVVRHDGLHVRSEAGTRQVSIEVVRLPRGAAEASGFLVLFEEGSPGVARAAQEAGAVPAPAGAAGDDTARENLRLAWELEGTRDYLQAVIEQELTVNEELQAASEEAHSANEELQSINEELETSKEEIQATNEELTTVNDELQARNEELLRVSNDWINLLECVEVPVIIVGRDLRIRRFSPEASEVLNLVPADVGRSLGSVHLGLALNLEALVTDVIESRVGQEREIFWHGRWYSLRLRPYQTSDRKVDGAVLVFIDVDTLKRAHQYSEAIVSTVREPLLVLDHELRIRTANRYFRQSFHVTAEETEGRLLFEIGRGQWDIPELRRLLNEVLLDGSSFEDLVVERDFDRIGARTMRLNGRRLPAEPGVTPQILLAIEDITAHRALEAMMHRQVEELAAADRAKNEFMAMLGHELRNPLAPVLFANEILTRRVSGEPTLERQCELIDRQVRQMGRLLDDLLEGSRASRGMITLQRAPVDLALLVGNALAAASLVFTLRRQEFTFEGPAEALRIHGDPVRLEQVVTNLLNNASKYTDPGGKIRVTLEAVEGFAVLRVADNGIGISPELLPRIFDLFTQGERGLDRSEGGLGIGLALVYSIVSLHGGTVTVHSDGPGLGSEFAVRLPLSEDLPEVAESSVPTVDVPAITGAAALSRKRVLVVDDNRDSADTLVELGEDWGYELQAAYDGPSAIAAALSYSPQVVLLDIGLPGMDGYQVAQRLRQEPALAGIRLVAFTGYGSSEDRRLAREAGFDHHLTKPVDPEELKKLLSTLLRAAAD